MLTRRQIESISKASCDLYDIYEALDVFHENLPIGDEEDEYTVGDALEEVMDILHELEAVFEEKES